MLLLNLNFLSKILSIIKKSSSLVSIEEIDVNTNLFESGIIDSYAFIDDLLTTGLAVNCVAKLI